MLKSISRYRVPRAMQWFLRGAALGAVIGSAEFALQHRTVGAAIAFAFGCLTIALSERG